MISFNKVKDAGKKWRKKCNSIVKQQSSQFNELYWRRNSCPKVAFNIRRTVHHKGPTTSGFWLTLKYYLWPKCTLSRAYLSLSYFDGQVGEKWWTSSTEDLAVLAERKKDGCWLKVCCYNEKETGICMCMGWCNQRANVSTLLVKDCGQCCFKGRPVVPSLPLLDVPPSTEAMWQIMNYSGWFEKEGGGGGIKEKRLQV